MGKTKRAKYSAKFLASCKERLLEIKEESLNRVRSARQDLYSSEENKGGDEADQTMRALAESELLSMNERMRRQLVEVEEALARIEAGTYGICEETEEPIEDARLVAIPWTRLSIEGAEIRESLNKRFAGA